MYFKDFKTQYCGKRSGARRQISSRVCPKIKRGGAKHRPALKPLLLLLFWQRNALGGQNLAALGTAAGENLTAVGSSHSLAETVNLGTMATAGLVGTLHLGYTS